MVSRNPFFSIIVVSMLLFAGCAAPSLDEGLRAGPGPTPAAGMAEDSREMIVPEPVFNGTVYVTEAGMEHDLSVVLVHGTGDRASGDWERVIPGLAAQYHVVAFDLPGFGRSSRSNTLYSPERYTSFLQWIVARYVKGPFVLIGHSMGGAMALCYAAERPDGLQRLVLVDVVGILNRGSYLKELFLMNDDLREAGPPSKRAREFDEFLRFMLDDLMDEARSQKIGRFLERPGVRKVLLGSNPKKISAVALMLEDFGPIVDRVRTPTLLIWGEYDRVAPLRTAHALAGRLAGTRLEIIPQAGHVPMRLHAAEFNRLVMAEIASAQTATPATWEEPVRPELLERVAYYEHEKGLVLTGSYKSITLIHCGGVTIRGVPAERIETVSSDVTIENSSIRGKDVALLANRSEIIGTNVLVEANRAIVAEHSHFDLAGVQLKGRTAAIWSDDRDVLLFSICHSESPYYSGPLHGDRTVTRQMPL